MNEKNAYNLIDEPWIPVLMRDGNNRSVSLGDIFADANGTIADLTLNPYERISVFRLLLCIAQAATDMKSEREWFYARASFGQAATNYLGKWRERFFLFGKGAFLQVDCLAPGGTIPDTSRLILHSSHHFGSPLFSHEIDTRSETPLSPPILAIALLTYLNFSASGGTPTCIWKGLATRQVGAAASPCRSQSKLFTFVMGESLLETVWMNLLTENQLEELKIQKGRPCWESSFDDCDSVETNAGSWLGPIDKSSRRTIKPTLLGVLAPLSRFIKLKQEDSFCLICEGFSFPPWRDPSATYYGRMGKNGAQEIVPLRVNAERLPWRDLSSILELGTEKGGAIALEHLATLSTRMPSDHPFSIWTGGVCSDADRDKDMFAGEWRFTRPMSALRKESLSKYESAVEWADRQCAALYFACKTYALSVKTSDPTKPIKKQKETELVSPFSIPAERAYWDILAQPKNQKIVQNVESDTDQDDWKKVCRKAAEESYRRACPAMNARQMEAYAQGFAKLLVRDDTKKNTSGTDSEEDEGGGNA